MTTNRAGEIVDTTPVTNDIICLNDVRTRVEYVSGYDVYVVTPEGGRFSFSMEELSPTSLSRRPGVASWWYCMVDSNGRRK